MPRFHKTLCAGCLGLAGGGQLRLFGAMRDSSVSPPGQQGLGLVLQLRAALAGSALRSQRQVPLRRSSRDADMSLHLHGTLAE